MNSTTTSPASGRSSSHPDEVTVSSRRGSATIPAALAGVAAVIAILGVTVALFLNPMWIGFEQERSGVPAITSRP